MWGTIGNVLTSGNALFILGTVVLLAVIFGVFAKLGIISVHRKGVKIGSRPDALGERFILRRQIDYVRTYVAAREGAIRALVEENPDGQAEEYREDPEYYIKWILEKAVLYMVTNWIMFNNITHDPAKNAARTHDLRLFVSSLSGNGEYDSRVLGKSIDAWGMEVLEGLCRIREELSERR